LSPEFEDQILNNIFPLLDEERKKSLRKLRQNKKIPEVFVASFTDDASAQVEGETRPGDRLSQWRAYSNPNGGFSLGFDSKLIMGGWKLSGLKGTFANLLLRCSSPCSTEPKTRGFAMPASSTSWRIVSRCFDKTSDGLMANYSLN
jgi:hypothetical protein